MQQLILTFHVLACVSLIILVLLQQGKGAEMGASFGSGASQTVFGSQGSGSFLLKITGGLAAIFFATSLILGYLASDAHPRQAERALVSVPTVPVSTDPAAQIPSTNPPASPTDEIPGLEKESPSKTQ